MSKFVAPAPPYLGPAAHVSPGDNKPINRIVLHSTVSPCIPGGARKIAAYFRSQSAGGSAHYVVDPSEAVQVVYDGVVAWHAPPNPHSLGVEMCDMPVAGDASRWEDKSHQAMFNQVVELVASLCLAYDVPPLYRGPIALKLGRRGITTHADVSAAFKQSTHWDPGAWPRRKFMKALRAEVKRQRSAS